MKTKYKYKLPLGNLYKVPVKTWNDYFGYRGKGRTCYVYVSISGITVEYRTSLSAKIITLILLPVIYPIFSFIYGYKEINEEVLDIFLEEQRGTFGSDYIPADTDGYDEIIEFLRDCGKW